MKALTTIGFAVFLSSAVFVSMDHMKEAEHPKSIERYSDKATLVIHLEMSNLGLSKGRNYFLDSTFIGQDRKTSYFITKADTGIHWLFFTRNGKVTNTGKFYFEAGKIYYIQRLVVPYACIMKPRSPQEFSDYFIEDKPKYFKFVPQQEKLEVLSPETIAEARKVFEEENKENPDRHKDVLNYKGY